MRKYKWGIIGPGKIARKFASDLVLLENAELHGVSSRELSRAQAFAEDYQAAVAYDDHRQLIADPEVDIIYVATPHAFHKEMTIACLKAGVPVLCEKPIGLNLAEAEEMVHLARKNGVFLMEALWTACLPHFLRVKDLVSSQQYGRVMKLESDFGFATNFDPHGRLYNKSLGGGSLLDIGIYPVFAAVTLLGAPESLEATATMTETHVDAEMHAKLGYPGGVTAALHSTFLKHTPVETTIHCEKAVIKINRRWHEPTAIEIHVDGHVVTETFETEGFGYQYEAAEAMNCLEHGLAESQLMSLDDTLTLSRVIDRIQNEINLFYD